MTLSILHLTYTSLSPSFPPFSPFFHFLTLHYLLTTPFPSLHFPYLISLILSFPYPPSFSSHPTSISILSSSHLPSSHPHTFHPFHFKPQPSFPPHLPFHPTSLTIPPFFLLHFPFHLTSNFPLYPPFPHTA